MNRVFKTKWSAAHQQYVVTDEHRATKGKASKSAVALTVAALMMAGAHAAYMEPGFEASRYHEVDQAQQSWETAEYQKDWGLAAMNASKAYALASMARRPWWASWTLVLSLTSIPNLEATVFQPPMSRVNMVRLVTAIPSLSAAKIKASPSTKANTLT